MIAAALYLRSITTQEMVAVSASKEAVDRVGRQWGLALKFPTNRSVSNFVAEIIAIPPPWGRVEGVETNDPTPSRALRVLPLKGEAKEEMTRDQAYEAGEFHGEERQADRRERLAVGHDEAHLPADIRLGKVEVTAPVGMPSTWISDFGTMLESRPDRTWAQRLTTKLVSSCGRGLHSSDLKIASICTAVLHVGVSEQADGGSSDACRQVAAFAVPRGPCSGSEQHIALRYGRPLQHFSIKGSASR